MSSKFDRLVRALERDVGLELCADKCPVRDLDDLAARVTAACGGLAAGRRKRDEDHDDDIPEDLNPAILGTNAGVRASKGGARPYRGNV